jgi:hypothetical protein
MNRRIIVCLCIWIEGAMKILSFMSRYFHVTMERKEKKRTCWVWLDSSLAPIPFINFKYKANSKD